MKETREEAAFKRIIARIAEAGRTGTRQSADGGPDRPVRGLPWNDYMYLCLYDEEYGYYTSGSARVGKDGDFYTSASIGSVLGDVLADYLTGTGELLNGRSAMYEWGSGTGRLGLQLLARWRSQASAAYGSIRYRMVDGHPAHLQAAAVAADEAGFASQVEYLAPANAERALSDEARPAILLANELLDAFPVRRLIRREGRLWEIGVTWDELEGKLADCYLPLSEDEAARANREECGMKLREGQEAEWRSEALDWLRKLCRLIPEGTMILIDYGDEAEELFASHRMKGTLLCYYKHQAHDDPYIHLGEQDMTAHVNFTAVRQTAEDEGWMTDYYGTQKQFLIDHGVLQLLQSHQDPNPFSEVAKRNRAIRQLLLSDGMSELFKVLVLKKRQ